jgi:hypothetical protein
MAKRPESGAEVTALQTLTRPPGVFAPREALGVRRVYRRFSPVVHPKITLIAQILVLEFKFSIARTRRRRTRRRTRMKRIFHEPGKHSTFNIQHRTSNEAQSARLVF